MSLHYHKLGDGPNVLLAFHGIGQDGLSCFKTFEDQLGAHYTIYAFDLFFHGKSKSDDVGLVTKSFWIEIIKDFLTKNNIPRFDIAGFSIGGRFALATLEAFPEKVRNVFLIAPDGISEHPVYSLATRVSSGRKLFQWTMQNYPIFLKAVHFFKKSGLVTNSLARFTEQMLSTSEKRKTIYKSWIAFRKLRFDIPAVFKLATANNVQIFLFTGKFDKLLKAQTVKRLSKLLPKDQNIHLKSGHSQVVVQTGAWICTLFE